MAWLVPLAAFIAMYLITPVSIYELGEEIFCAEEYRVCPDGFVAPRIGSGCNFAECPVPLPADVFEDPQNGSFVIEGKHIRLQNGLSELEIMPGSAEKLTTRYFGNEAIGDLNDDGHEDIVFLITHQSGGTGTFYYVVAALFSGNGYRATNAILLGDRIAPQTTEIQGNMFIVNYADRKDNEPMTISPSVGISRVFMVTNMILKDITPSRRTNDTN